MTMSKFIKLSHSDRYSPSFFKDHIKLCCDKKYHIEAYTLTLQYVENLIYLFFNRKPYKLSLTDTPKILCVLVTLNLIDENYYELFIKINQKRNILSHNIIQDHKYRETINNNLDYLDLTGLINKTEDLYISYDYGIITQFNEHRGVTDEAKILPNIDVALIGGNKH